MEDELARRLWDEAPHAPIATASNAGRDGYIGKPIDTRAIAKQVRGFMRRHETD